MAFFLLLLCILISAAIVSYAHHVIRRQRQGCAHGHGRHEQAALKLPPGSMGLPYIGETLQLYSQDPSVFLSSKQKRLVRGPLGPEALRKLVPDIEAAVRATLAAWADGDAASTFHAMKRLSFDVGIVTIFGGRLDERRKEELRRNYAVVEKGYNSFPNSFPGTLYYKAIQQHNNIHECHVTKTAISHAGEAAAERRAERHPARAAGAWRARGRPARLPHAVAAGGDDDGDEAALLTDEQVADNVIGVLFSAGHAGIHEADDGGRRPLAWAQTRSMTLTHRVILESLRMASIISFTFREAVADVEYKGFLIPKGWKVMPLFRNIHHSPDYFQDPQKFDPSRFKVAPRPSTFTPFGSGVHACPGNELAKLEMLVLIHHLVTGYRWEVVGSSDDVEYSPFPVPRHGLLARLRRDDSVCVVAVEKGATESSSAHGDGPERGLEVYAGAYASKLEKANEVLSGFPNVKELIKAELPSTTIVDLRALFSLNFKQAKMMEATLLRHGGQDALNEEVHDMVT
uniref:Uncharacterized protein n=1 Tax=Aegilops tauschii TaxID=37682 RepID=M8CAP3_AEGTA